jgi:hypothetical protein
MDTVTGKLANVINVVRNIAQRSIPVAISVLKSRGKLPATGYNSDHTAPLNNRANLPVRQLPLVRYKRTTIAVAGNYRPLEKGESLPKRPIGTVR